MPEANRKTPWPKTRPVVFLCDTRTSVEEQLLTNWVNSTAPRKSDPTPTIIALDLDKESTHRSDAATRALAAVLEMPAETAIVPLRVGWLPDRDLDRSSPRFRDLLLTENVRSREPFARWFRQQSPERARLLAADSATIGELLERYSAHSGGAHDAGFAGFVTGQAAISLDVAERALAGQRYKVPRGVIAGIESSADYLAATAQLAASTGQSVEEVREKVHKYLREMVAMPSRFYIDGMGAIARWITSLGYSHIVTDADNIEQTRRVMRENPSMLLWTHKSHVDGIALLSVMYENDFPAPHTVGGINMAIPGVGYTSRRSGTIFIRRSFADNEPYKLALQRYLGFLMAKRFPLSWAFEGTRSRNGKLGRPRFGILKYVVDAAHHTETENVHLIPVSINYDLISETGEYALEESGAAKEAESLGWFMQYLRRLQAPKGNIYLDFGEPVVIEGVAPEPTPEVLNDLMMAVGREANRCVPVTLASLMAMALLGAAPRALTYGELDRAMLALLGWLRDEGVRITGELDALDVPELEDLAEHIFEGDVIQRIVEGPEVLFEIGEDQYPIATYYANTIAHHFVYKAIVETALATVSSLPGDQRLEAFWAEVDWLRDVTELEFYHPPSDGLRPLIEHHLASQADEWADTLADGSAAEVFAVVARTGPAVAHAVLLPIFEAYWLVTRTVNEWAAGKEPSESEVVSHALRWGRASLRRRRISNPASISKAMFKGAYAFLKQQDLVGPADDESQAQARAELIARLEDAIRATQQVASVAHGQLFSQADEAAD